MATGREAEVSEYSVTVETKAPEGDDQRVGVAAVEGLMDLLADYDGIVSGGPEWDSWDASVGVEADSAAEATSAGAGVILERAEKAGLPIWPVVRLEVIDEEALNEVPTGLPDLVSGPEVGRILGVNRQRVHQLAHQHSQFPKPLYQLGVGSLWDRHAIERFAQQWERKPGRPRAS